MEPLAKQYDPFAVEQKWVTKWAEEPYKSDPFSKKTPFCIVIPPPNVNGNLHLGHAFDNTIIDTLIRFKRMQGYEALYQPGTDHAGITTQVQVERDLKAKEGLSRYDLGREKFLERVWAWKEKYGGIILSQLQRLGISADWSRTRFTMDEGLSKAVRYQFVKLYNEGKAYKGKRIVNWDPVSQTTLSDLEVDREERSGKLYTLSYPLEDGNGDIRIATVRPETIFADQAIAVHPEDERYSSLVGKKACIPLTQHYIPIITDSEVEIGFGTGALKITPAHDPLDFEIGQRHNLDKPSVIDLEAKLTGELVPEQFRGLDRFAARKPIVEALEAKGLLVETKDHTIALGFSQRTKEPVEPILSEQWFVNTDEIAKHILKGLDDGEMAIIPQRYEKVNRDWLENLRHWNVSRQLWWGHQIPAWYDLNGNIYVPDLDDPFTDCPNNPKYANIDLTQDSDVFDTWFSSNLWPFSTLGWPDTNDPFYKKFYPTSVLVTGYDILFFWVARMQMAGYEFTNQAPFKHVFLHGLVLDEHGQKMSKSKGNGIDPLEVIDQYGADSLRFATTYASTGGQDIRWDNRRVEMGRNFNNKLWNATRFAIMNLSGDLNPQKSETLADRWILSRLQSAIRAITVHLEAYDLGAASRVAYDFVWSEFCDWYLEAIKPQLKANDPRSCYVLKKVLLDIIKLLHPMIPFITAELYQVLEPESNLSDVGYADYPKFDESLLDKNADDNFKNLQDAITAVRNLRNEANISHSAIIPTFVKGKAVEVIKSNAEVFSDLAKVKLVDEIRGASLLQVVPDLELVLGLEGVINIAEYKAKQEKRLRELEKQQQIAEKKLSNEKFINNAPAEVIAEQKKRLKETERLMDGVKAILEQL